jgi:serine/threonine protein kinase
MDSVLLAKGLPMNIIRQIAHGGFGVVEEVELESGERRARKTFAPRADVLAAGDPDKLRSRFIREVRVQEALPQGSFVPILDFDLECPVPWYLMPLADKNFKEEIDEARRAGTIPKAGIADILNGLEELHALGYVHRDLKPENVLLHAGAWKLCDFGLVMLPPTDNSSRLTSSASTWGTWEYWSPEQAGGMRDVTAATDIYAFGCILHDIFDGSRRIPLQQHSCTGPI